MKKLFSVVIPIYKSEQNLPITVPYIIERIPVLFPDYNVELILINDGSPDDSWTIMKKYQEAFPDVIKIANLARNFGQVMAVHCGVCMAKGQVIGVISADLQDPFELFVDMLKEWENGAELVCGIRADRKERGLSVLFSKLTHALIHRFVNSSYPKGGFDFFLMDRAVAERYIPINERNGSPQVLLLSLSHNIKFISYERKERKLGTSGWTMSKKIKFFIDTFVTNTYLPMRVMSVTGVFFSIAAFFYVIYIIVGTLLMGNPVPGWSSLAALVTLFSGLILASLGVIGEYLWRIFDAVKGRPLYIVDEAIEGQE